MTPRRRAVLLLLWSRHDLLPAPKGSLRPSSGLAPQLKVPCGDCVGGWRLDRFKRRLPCLACGGREAADGVRVKRGRGWVTVDPMDSLQAPVQTVDAAAAPTRPARMVNCDGCGGDGAGTPHLRDPEDPSSEYRDPCARCGGSGRRPVTVFRLDVDRAGGDTLEQALERRALAGSYRELDATLAVLPGLWRRALERLPRSWPQIVAEASPDVLAALEALELLLPAELRVPAAIRQAARRAEQAPTLAVGRGAGQVLLAKRDKEIRKLDREGKPRQWIASLYGMSVASVKVIVSGREVA